MKKLAVGCCYIVALTVTAIITARGLINYGSNSMLPKLAAKDLQIKHLEKMMDEHKVAMKFSNLFLMIANPKQIMDFTALEKLIYDKKEFHRKRKFSYKNDSFKKLPTAKK